MIAAWMLHATLAGLLLGLAARAAESALAAYRLPVRWAWAGAAAGALALPAVAAANLPSLIASLLPASFAAGGSVLLPAPGGAGPAVRPDVPEGLALPALPAAADPIVLAAWIGGSALLAALAIRAWLSLRRRRGAWKRTRVEGTEVLVSERVGPALVGFLDPAPVLPDWVLDLPPREWRTVLRHELEHRRARDPVLLGCALAALVAVPWNPALWWIVRRLRLAVELDCDRRVLAGGTPPAEYGAVLLEITRGRKTVPLPAVALGQRSSQLERRIRVMTDTTPRFRAARTALMALVGAGLLAAACDAPTPTEEPPGGVEAAASRAADGDPTPGGDDAAAALGDESPTAESTEARTDAPGGTIRIRDGGGPLEVDGKTPLVVVDGVRADEGSASLDDLDPNRIERIEVLKGPAAVDHYGEEGRNGVIRITTKAAVGPNG